MFQSNKWPPSLLLKWAKSGKWHVFTKCGVEDRSGQSEPGMGKRLGPSWPMGTIGHWECDSSRTGGRKGSVLQSQRKAKLRFVLWKRLLTGCEWVASMTCLGRKYSDICCRFWFHYVASLVVHCVCSYGRIRLLICIHCALSAVVHLLHMPGAFCSRSFIIDWRKLDTLLGCRCCSCPCQNWLSLRLYPACLPGSVVVCILNEGWCW